MSVGTQRLREDADRLRAGAIAKREDPAVVDTALAAEAAEMMEAHRITCVLVVDENAQLIGAINSNDLMRAKVI